MSKDRGSPVITRVLFVYPWTGSDAETHTDGKRPRAQIEDGWYLQRSSNNRERALDQLDEARCVFMFWLPEAAKLARDDLVKAVSMIPEKQDSPEGQASKGRLFIHLPSKAREKLESLVGDMPGPEESSSEEFPGKVRDTLEEIGNDRQLAAAFATTAARAQMQFITLAAVVGVHRERIVWYSPSLTDTSATSGNNGKSDAKVKADEEALEPAGDLSKELMDNYKPTGRVAASSLEPGAEITQGAEVGSH